VFNLPVHLGENSTYNLQFRGPQLRCTSLSYYNNTSPLEYYSPKEVGDLPSLVTPIFVSKWDWESRWVLESRDAPLYSIAKHNPLTLTAQRTSKNRTSFEVLRATAELICKPYSMLYDVNVSFPRGKQTVQYTTSDMKMLSSIGDYSGDRINFDQPGIDTPLHIKQIVGEAYGKDISDFTSPIAWLGLPADAQTLQDWNHRMRILLPLATEWALLDALGQLLEDKIYSRSRAFSLDPGNPWCNESSISTNGTTSFVCGNWIADYIEVMNISCKSTCLACSNYRT
jgi:hypothetical protein